MKRLHRLTFIVATLMFVLVTAASGGSSDKLVIDSAVAELDHELLWISGHGFEGRPRVWLLDQGELRVLSVSPRLIEARLPRDVEPGTYRLVVSGKHNKKSHVAGSRTDSLDVTIGTVGPEGPPGQPGVDGRDGMDGQDGGPGPPGPAGAPGATGAPGVAGPRGASWTSGAGAPDPVSGLDGDFYFDVSTGDVHTKIAQQWSVVANLIGPVGPPGPPGPVSSGGDSIAALSNRLGVLRSDIAVPFEAMRAAQCSDGDQVAFFANSGDLGRVVGVWGREALNEVYEFDILLSAGPGLSSSLVGAEGLLKISIGGSLLEPTGEITAFAALGADPGGSLYVATLRPKLARGGDATGFDVYENVTPADVLQSELDQIGVTPAVSLTTSFTDAYRVQWNESDLQFVQRIVEEAGAFFFVRDNGVLVVADSNDVFPAGPTLPYLGPFVDPGANAVAVSSLASGAARVPQQVTVRGWDYLAKETVEGQSDSGPGLLPALVFDPLTTASQTAHLAARNLYERALVEANQRQGTSNAPGIRAGRGVSIQGLGGGFGGTFYVTSVQHVLYPEGDDDCFAYGNQFTAVPSSVAFRPARVTPRPRVSGLLTAVVVNVQDPAGIGRIKVRFPWAEPNEGESNWARVVVSNGPGASWHLPEIDDEVLVGFVQGDPRHPVVVGALWNGVDMPPPSP